MPRKRVRKKRRGQRDLSAELQQWRFEVGADEHGQRLDKFLASRIKWRSRRGIQDLVGEVGAVEILAGKDPQQATIGGLRDSLKLRTGQEVVVRQPNPQAHPEVPLGPDPGELEVIYEDEYLLAVNKPPHISVHPSRGHLTGSLIHLIHERHRAVWGETEDMPTLCHRLDRETSGVLLTAKDQLSRTRVGRQFEKRAIDKTYQALVLGEIEQEGGVIDLPLGKDLSSEVRLKMGVRQADDGLASRTEWKVVRRLPGYTLVQLHPLTGRQHQLRVHLAAIGHPILGDKLYLGDEQVFIRSVDGELTDADREFLQMDRQALHNWKLEIEHPFTGRPLALEAPLFPDIQQFMRRFD
jgi:23S rRNA pseudouridine1911/1915/1917 synthase